MKQDMQMRQSPAEETVMSGSTAAACLGLAAFCHQELLTSTTGIGLQCYTGYVHDNNSDQSSSTLCIQN